MEPAVTPQPLDLLIVIEEFAIGGVSTLYAAICLAASDEGLNCAVVGVEGPSAEELNWGTTQLIQVDRSEVGMLALVHQLTGEARRTVWALSPRIVRLLSATADFHGMAMVAHGQPETMLEWLGPTSVNVLRSLLAAAPELGLMVHSRELAPQHAEFFGVDVKRVRALPHVSDLGRSAASTPVPIQGRPQRIVVPMRLSGEKRYLVSAAAALAEASGLPLVVVGAGPDLSWVEEFCRDRVPDGRVICDVDIHRHITPWDLVVAVGLIGLEVAQRGIPLVVASTANDGELVGIVTPETAQDFYWANFFGAGRPAASAHEVWQQCLNHDLQSYRRVADLVSKLNDKSAALSAVLEACDDGLERDSQSGDTARFMASADAWISDVAARDARIAFLTADRNAHASLARQLRRELDQLADL